ncbi:MAG: acyl carrier protein [Verrucomicrobia bacterium]|nr:acyl carrier protein [Verrucomicrobiota bacterium]
MPLGKAAIFEVVKANTLRVLPDLRPEEVALNRSLTDLGANSVDRVEVVICSLEDLNLRIPTWRLHGLRNLADLVDLLYQHQVADAL